METVYPSRIYQHDMGCQAKEEMYEEKYEYDTKLLQCITNCQCNILCM